MDRLRLVLVLAATATAGGCESDGPTTPAKPEPPKPNFVQLQSDAGDYIGGGRSYGYTQEDAVIRVTAKGGRLTVQIDGDEYWTGEFQAPGALARIEPGTYANLRRYPFHDAATGGLSWSGEGRGCNRLAGSFTVDSVRYAGEQLAAVHLRFEQRCEEGATALRGTIHWRAEDTTMPPGPVTPVPSTLWRPAAGATPATGSFVYLVSDPGDFVGAGRTFSYPAGGFTVRASGGRVSVSGEWWSGDFQAMSTLGQLQPGYYGDLQRYPFHNPAKGGLDWSGQGRGCNKLTGWFAVDQVTYTAGRLTAIELRFEQHCEGASPALRGAIRWSE